MSARQRAAVRVLMPRILATSASVFTEKSHPCSKIHFPGRVLVSKWYMAANPLYFFDLSAGFLAQFDQKKVMLRISAALT